MVAILLYWFGLFIVFSIAGLGVVRLFKIESSHPLLVPILGSFGTTLFAGTWALFLPLNFLFDITLLTVSAFMIIYLKSSVRPYLYSLKNVLNHLTPFLKILLGLITVMAAVKSAGLPTIIDNESYYIQTIKWLDTYGWVHGLANLHPFLAQQSGWHLMHSAVNLNNGSIGLNDINGFYLTIANTYALSHLSKYLNKEAAENLIIGLFPLFNVVLFQFIDAPSPDLGIYVIGYFIFSEYLKRKTHASPSLFTLLSFLVMWAVFIKGTGIFLVVFPLAYWFENKEIIGRSGVFKSVLTGFFVALLFFGKNIWVSGYTLFPLDIFTFDVPWKLSSVMMDFLGDQMQPAGYKMTAEQISDTSALHLFKHWLLLPKLTGIFNSTITLLLLIFPFIIKKTSDSNASFWLYISTLLQMTLLWATSPQYRFFLGFMMLLFLIIFSKVIRHKKLIYPLFAAVWIGLVVIMFLPSLVGKLNTNTLNLEHRGFQISQLWKPQVNTQHENVHFSEEKIKNLHYYDPQNLEFFWGTGDGPLPCVQKEQLLYFETYFKIIPQPLGEQIDEGFYTRVLEQ